MGYTERRASIGFPMLLSIAAFLFVGATLGALGVRSFRASEAQDPCSACHGMTDEAAKHACYSSPPCYQGGSSGGGSYGGGSYGGSTGGGTTGGAAPPPPPPPPPPMRKDTPEEQMTEEVMDYIEALERWEGATGERVVPCMAEELRNPRYMESSPYTYIFSQLWQKEVLSPHGVEGAEMTALPTCPSREKLEKVMEGELSEECEEALADGAQRLAPVFIQGEKSEEEIRKMLNGYLRDHPDWDSDDCEIPDDLQGKVFHQYAKERVKVATCENNDDCDRGFYCDESESGRVAKPLLRGMAARFLEKDSFYGTCTKLPEGGCVPGREVDCGKGETCVLPPQPMVYCPDPASCPFSSPPYGFCEESVHDAAEKGEVVDLRPITREKVIADLEAEGGDTTPQVVEEEYLERVDEYLEKENKDGEKEGIVITINDYEKGITTVEEKKEEEAGGNEREGAEELPALMSKAVEICLNIVEHRDEVPEEAVEVAQEAAQRLGAILVVAATKGTEQINVPEVVAIVQDLQNALPEGVEEVVFDEREAEERGFEIGGDIRFMLRQMVDMLGWVGDLNTELAGKDFFEAKQVAHWKDLHAEAERTFHEEVRPLCEELAATLRTGDFESAGEHMDPCREGMEGVFKPLEESMKEEMERRMNSDTALQQFMMSFMQKHGMPALGGEDMHDGGKGGGGEEWSCVDTCEERYPHLQVVFDTSDERIREVNAACLSEEEESSACEVLFEEYDERVAVEVFGAKGEQYLKDFDGCVNACGMARGGEEGGEHDWRREMERACGEASRHAATLCCQMRPAGEARVGMSCIDGFLAEWGASACIQVHPGELSGVDSDCGDSDYEDVCAGPWQRIQEDCQRYGSYTDPQCTLAHFRSEGFPEECKPPEEDLKRMEEGWRGEGDMRSGACTFLSVMLQTNEKVANVTCPYHKNDCTAENGRVIAHGEVAEWGSSVCTGGDMGGGGEGMGDGCTLRDIVLTGDRGSVNSAVCRFDGGGGWCQVPMQSGPRADGLVVDPFPFSYADVRSHGGCDCNDDGVFTMDGCPAPGWTGPGGGGTGGGSGESGCFYNDATVNGRSAGFSIHCKHDGTECRRETAQGELMNMAEVILGSPGHCYGPWDGGGTGGGGSARVCYNARNGIIECETAWDETGKSQTSCFQPNVGDAMWQPIEQFQDVQTTPVPCPGMGGGGGGGTGESGCFWTNSTRNGQYIGYTIHTRTDGSDPRVGDPSGQSVDMAGVNLGTKNCYGPGIGGGTGGGGTYGGGTCYGSVTLRNGMTVNNASCPSGGFTNCTGMVTSATGPSSSTSFSPSDVTNWGPTMACGPTTGGGTTYPSGGTAHVCIYRGAYVNGSPAGEDLKMVEGYYYGVSSGKRYEPSQVSNMMMCDCGNPPDGNFDNCGSAPSGGTYPSGTSTYPSGTTTTQPASCVAHSASWGIRPDGTNVPGPLISKAGESTVTLPNGTVEPMSNFREFGPWSCQSASRGGIFHAIGSFLRSLVAGF